MKQDSHTNILRVALVDAYADLGLPMPTMSQDILSRASRAYDKMVNHIGFDLNAPVRIDPQSQPLSKLEHFAGLAMQGMLANPELGRRGAHVTACEARQHAKYLLQELQTQGEK